jgi:flagellum-specific ATP synthase
LRLAALREATSVAELVRRRGSVDQVSGLAIEACGPDVAIGEICRIYPRNARNGVLAQVVALRPGKVTLMPFGVTTGLATGCVVEAIGRDAVVPVGRELLGRVIDGLGQPLDGLPKAATSRFRASRTPPINPLQRPVIDQVLETGIRAIDTLLTVGRGQRIGIFAGSGVGKSTLLGMIAREAKTDVNVIALIGERGREVREFIDKQLGTAGLARSVVVAAAADQPPLARLQAAYAALAIAEDFRNQGLHVTLTLDSITRFATARREVGLSAGEPPTARGFTPSVFAELPELCERCGTAASGGSITALMTVLVEGDDPSEPIADTLRAILDGHVMLSRNLAQRGHFPAIDILSSASRVMSDIVSKEERDAAIRLRSTIDLIERNRQLVEIGAYAAGSNPALDRALRKQDRIDAFLRQATGGVARSEALDMLMALQGEEA